MSRRSSSSEGGLETAALPSESESLSSGSAMKSSRRVQCNIDFIKSNDRRV